VRLLLDIKIKNIKALIIFEKEDSNLKVITNIKKRFTKAYYDSNNSVTGRRPIKVRVLVYYVI
jgi:hypothetical protein